jgi:hypothetical protein
MPDQQADQDPADGAANSIRFEVHGKPPLKGEAISVFNPKHGQADRIRALFRRHSVHARSTDSPRSRKVAWHWT